MSEQALDVTAARDELIRTYFRRIDAFDPSMLDLFTDDAELWFPKFGLARGKQEMQDFAQRLQADLGSLTHDIDGLDIMHVGDRAVVLGRERGTTPDGREWPDGGISTGEFCNVFGFEGDLISSVRIYADPDFTSSHREKVDQLFRGSNTGRGVGADG